MTPEVDHTPLTKLAPETRNLSIPRDLRRGARSPRARMARVLALMLVGSALVSAVMAGGLRAAPLSYTSQSSLNPVQTGGLDAAGLFGGAQGVSFSSSGIFDPLATRSETFKRLTGADRILETTVKEMEIPPGTADVRPLDLVNQTGQSHADGIGRGANAAQMQGDDLRYALRRTDSDAPGTVSFSVPAAALAHSDMMDTTQTAVSPVVGVADRVPFPGTRPAKRSERRVAYDTASLTPAPQAAQASANQSVALTMADLTPPTGWARMVPEPGKVGPQPDTVTASFTKDKAAPRKLAPTQAPLQNLQRTVFSKRTCLCERNRARVSKQLRCLCVLPHEAKAAKSASGRPTHLSQSRPVDGSGQAVRVGLADRIDAWLNPVCCLWTPDR